MKYKETQLQVDEEIPFFIVGSFFYNLLKTTKYSGFYFYLLSPNENNSNNNKGRSICVPTYLVCYKTHLLILYYTFYAPSR